MVLERTDIHPVVLTWHNITKHHTDEELDKDYQVLQSTQTDMTCALAYFMIALLFEQVLMLCLLPTIGRFKGVAF